MSVWFNILPRSIKLKTIRKSKSVVVVSVSSFRTGDGKLYPFKDPGLTLRISKDLDSDKWNCCCPQMEEVPSRPSLTTSIATSIWLMNFCRMFEQVLDKRSFERSEEEKTFCSKLWQYFDYSSYRDLNPIFVTRYGLISKLSSQACIVIDWENGDRDSFERQKLPKDLRTAIPGDEVHISVKVDFNTGNTVGIAEVLGIKRKENVE